MRLFKYGFLLNLGKWVNNLLKKLDNLKLFQPQKL